MIWFTSDLHLGHERIIELCGRPFKNVHHMNTELVDGWNSVVEPKDTVYVLGDLALGKLNESLQWAAMLTGNKFLVPGNHDRCWLGHKKVRAVDVKRYEEAGFTVLPGLTSINVDGTIAMMCHFPYVGDSQEVDRHVNHRPTDHGYWLLHGHTHWATGITSDHPRQIHVGVDAWHYRPVPQDTIRGIIETSEWISDTLDGGTG